MSSAEALREILTFLNRNEFRRSHAATKASPDESLPHNLDESPLYIADSAVFACYATLRMGTIFHPIQSLHSIQSGSTYSAYEAALTLDSPAQAHAPAALLSYENLAHWMADDQAVIYLDRLARTLHTLNFLARGTTGDLHLNVHPQHLLAVHADHGRVFEQILAQCGLQPEQIVLEICEHAIRDKQRLKEAIAAWQSRRYRIAIDDFGAAHTQLVRVLGLKPDIIKFNRSFIERQLTTASGRHRLLEQLQHVRAQRMHTIAMGADSAEMYETARQLGFSAVQGLWLIKPEASLTTDERLSERKIFPRKASVC